MTARLLPIVAVLVALAGCADVPAPDPSPAMSQAALAEEARRASELAPARHPAADRARASALMREARARRARPGADRAAVAVSIRNAALLGDRDAKFLLATDEDLREATERSPEGALAWLTRAAVQGLPRAQFALAEEYANGLRIRREQGWANVWYERAARQGNVDAARALARRARSGAARGVDDEASYFWSSIAVRLGARDAIRDRAEAAALLAAEERQEIDAIVAAWRPVGGVEDIQSDAALTRFIQAELVANGYDAGPDDGVMGARSVRALIAFKSAMGVARPTDAFDPATILALRDAAIARAAR
jgi:localization factor PodJL